MDPEVGHLAPMSDEILALSLRGLDLPARPRALDLCCGNGRATLRIARELGARVTAVDLIEDLFRGARERASAEGLAVEFVAGDAREIRVEPDSVDLALALGGALTYLGRGETLARLRTVLRPGASLLISDLVYLDSPAPEEVRRALGEADPPRTVRPLDVHPEVRKTFEEGGVRNESEEGYRALLREHGYETLFSFCVAESAWNDYYRRAAEGRFAFQAPDAPPDAPPVSPVLVEEIAAWYSLGGRWAMAYLVCGARRDR